MSQTAYTQIADTGFAGMIADSGGDHFLVTRALSDATSMGFGLGVETGTDPNTQFAAFSGAGTLFGLLAHKQNKANAALLTTLGIEQNETASIMRRGRLWVVTEETIAVGDPVFVRHTTGTGTVIGAFRNDADGAAEVSTLTPTVVNDVTYTVDIHFPDLTDYHFEFLADATATATEICDGIRAAMVLDAEFTAKIVATGTTTLILTSQTAGENFHVASTGDGLFVIVATTPPVPTCQVVSNASWLEGATGAGIAILELNLP